VNWQIAWWSGLGAAALVVAAAAGWIFALPPAPSPTTPPPIAKEESDITLAALRPPKRQRPLIAIVGINDSSETTDYLMPYGILTRADVADVVTLGTQPGPMTLFPVLKVEPQATIAEFDARHPDGADYVIVPAMSRDDDPVVLHWIRNQASHGAIIIGVCAGAKVVASTARVARVLHVQDGNVLRRRAPRKPLNDGDPVEHFGYRDGISQPLFTKKDVQRQKHKRGARARWNASAPLDLVLVPDPLVEGPDAFGSYLVYRKLGQNLRLFNQRVLALANKLNIDPDLAGAYVVGRFKDGTPVVKWNDNGHRAENDFDFDHDDAAGSKCPMHAHIRKANPRGTTPRTSLASEKSRRIARRGIPYGAPISKAVADYPPSDPNPDLPRGLLFLCFQANIEKQFEFIQHTWIDNVIFPRGLLLQRNTGDDPLIGQDPNQPQDWPITWGEAGDGTEVFNFDAAVKLGGGEYFFAPSIPFLKSL